MRSLPDESDTRSGYRTNAQKTAKYQTSVS
jgi:hypothetical protein